MAILARRKDGSPVQTGDRVVIYIKGNQRHVGRVQEICDPFKFYSLGRLRLQTYRIMCDDGQLRPVHAWHIKIVLHTGRRAGKRPTATIATKPWQRLQPQPKGLIHDR